MLGHKYNGSIIMTNIDKEKYFREVIIKSARKAVQTNISFFEFCQNNETLKKLTDQRIKCSVMKSLIGIFNVNKCDIDTICLAYEIDKTYFPINPKKLYKNLLQ